MPDITDPMPDREHAEGALHSVALSARLTTDISFRTRNSLRHLATLNHERNQMQGD
jgi:hypothetical protein